VAAIGLCVACQKPFCASHQASMWNLGATNHGAAFVDLCGGCLDKRNEAIAGAAAADESRRELEFAALNDPMKRLLVAARSLAHN
jgi:hypothetical protein